MNERTKSILYGIANLPFAVLALIAIGVSAVLEALADFGAHMRVADKKPRRPPAGSGNP